MKKVLVALLMFCTSAAVAAEPSQSCLKRVDSDVKGAVTTLYPDIIPASIALSVVRTTAGYIQVMDDEPGEQGHKVYTKMVYKERNGKAGVWLNETAIFDAGGKCDIVYSKLGVVL